MPNARLKSRPQEFAVSLHGVSKSFGPDTEIVRDLWLDVGIGEILVLLGPSGGGKTTILRLIAGFLEPNRGRIFVGGREVAGKRWVPPDKRPVGMVFQDYALFPHLTVTQNVGFGLTRIQKDMRENAVQKVLKMVGLGAMGQRYPHELSGGEQQRVALARALAPRPKVVLLDEPFSNLDPYLRAQVREDIQQILRSAKTTAIFVTHDQEEALALADRLVLFSEGRVQQLGTSEDIYHRPATRFVADFVGQANFLPGRVTENAIETELGRWPIAVGLKEGMKVDVMLRPHDVGLLLDSSGTSEVVARQFLGEENRYTIKLPSGQRIRSTLPSHEVFHPGNRVKVKVNMQQAVVFVNNKAVDVPVADTRRIRQTR